MNRILLFLFTASVLLSCKTNKNLVYLNNTSDQELLTGVPIKDVEYYIQENDNLFVDIQSLSSEVNAMFNPSQATGTNAGTQQNFGQVSGQYLNGFIVDSYGEIKLPVIGSIQVVGLTVEEAKKLIQTKADIYIKDAIVKVKLLSFKVTVLGEVKSPGVYYNYNNRLTILEAISMANGITDYGRIKKILVLRPEEKGSKTYRLDLTDKKFLASEAFFLHPNDVIYVEPDQFKSVKLNSSIYSLFLSTLSTLILVLNVL